MLSGVFVLVGCWVSSTLAVHIIDARGEAIEAAVSESKRLPGGSGSVRFQPFASFELPAANLPEHKRPQFHAGKALANQPWIKAPTGTDARDGLGPVYNARTCLACHVNGGRGRVPDTSDEPIFAAIVRVSVPGEADPAIGSKPDVVYGEQFQGQSVALSHQLRGRITPKDPATNPEAPPEARIFIDWDEHIFTYADGETVTLRSPNTRIDELGYGSLTDNMLLSLRAAPAIAGMGLLEAIDQADINALSDEHDRDGDGISGRVNLVWDFEREKVVPGRFGWKANRANLRITTAGAFQGDVGITNPVFPDQPCTEEQPRCQRTPSGNNAQGFELPEHLLELTVGFVRNIGVPEGRPPTKQAVQGQSIFHEAGCAACHHPSFKTAPQSSDLAHLGEQIIWPYTDLLLHDMGAELADGRPDYRANGREWRTPPLWGIGLSARVNGINTLLHDGRARSVEEAILWHGGEGEAARTEFVTLSKEERQALIAFVESL